MQLYGFQQSLKQAIYDAWTDSAQNVCAQAATGAGKTVIFASMLHQHNGSSVAIAHRKELVGQMSIALGREEVKHRIIAPNNVVRFIVQEQLQELGRSWYDPNARCAVAGVNTIVNRKVELAGWMQQVTLWIQDEGHHLLENNVWGRAVQCFPNARGVGFTATPSRADRKGLGRQAHGLYDALVQAPPMRWLIDNHYLTDYQIVCSPSQIDVHDVPISEDTGDYVQQKLKKAVRDQPQIIGDIVREYQKHASGKLGVVFATDVETAGDIANKFNLAGIRAEVVSAKTPDKIRNEIIRRFRRREITILVNVDLFGEGFDLPAIEVVIFARPTASLALYMQQFGRVLRLMVGKLFGLVIDHTDNIVKHGLPDRPRIWTLDSGLSRSRDEGDELALKVCAGCTRPYERYLTRCPYCDYIPTIADRSRPEFVDGDLALLDPDVLIKMREAVALIDANGNNSALKMQYAGAPQVAIAGMLKNHRLRQDAQGALRESIAWWAGWYREQGRTDSEIYKRFYLAFGIDILSAQALGRPEAFTLADRINSYLGRLQ